MKFHLSSIVEALPDSISRTRGALTDYSAVQQYRAINTVVPTPFVIYIMFVIIVSGTGGSVETVCKLLASLGCRQLDVKGCRGDHFAVC